MPDLVLLPLVVAAAAAFLSPTKLLVIAGDCPLDFSRSNFTLASLACSNQNERWKCCRYINALVAVSVAHYAHETGQLGVPPAFTGICLSSVSETFKLYGIPPKATMFCGLGLKIRVSYQCLGRGTVLEMMQSSNFNDVIRNCQTPISSDNSCRKCLNSGLVYLHHLTGAGDNVTLSICRDAVFVTLANQGGNLSAIDMAGCYFGVNGLGVVPDVSDVSEPSSGLLAPAASPSPFSAQAPAQSILGVPLQAHKHKHRLTLLPVFGVVVIGTAVLLLLVLILLIRKKSRELRIAGTATENSWNTFPQTQLLKLQEGSSSIFRKFSYKETKKATDNFSTVIGKGGFGTVYKAQFSCGLTAAVKRMNKVSKQGEEEFCQEMELLARLHHRHLVALKGFCVEKNERFLVYEYMENGSLKDHLHSPGENPLRWESRLQIAVDVANALEYLHFYCDPPLCHRDIKSSNILLDENFVAKLADFGLAHAARSGAISFEPVNTDIRGTPGYMDPEYVVTQELTEKSDIYSYGVLLLELVTGRRAIQDNRNLVEWSKQLMGTDSKLPELVDPVIADSFDLEQLQMVVGIIQWCTQREGRARPSIKQVLRMLTEKLDPMHDGFVHVMEDEEGDQNGIRASKSRIYRSEVIYHSGDARCLPSSSSTTRSYCSRSVLLESGSPQSPHAAFSV